MLTIIAGSALCRGYQRIADTTHFELCTAEIFTRALRCAVRPGRTQFKVTPKEGVDLGGLDALRQLKWVVAIAVLLGAGLVVRLLDETGVAPLVPNLHGIALWVVPVLGLFELRRVVRTLAIVARRRQRRNEYRMPLEAPVVATDFAGSIATGRARDLSPSGLGLELSAPLALGTPMTVTMPLPALDDGVESVNLDVCVQSCRQRGDAWALGTRIVRCSDEVERRIVEYCYVVIQGERLRSDREVALPAPGAPELAQPQIAPMPQPIVA